MPPYSSCNMYVQCASLLKEELILIHSPVLRIIGLAIAVATLAYGGWTFYQIVNHLDATDIVKIVAQGGFLWYAI
jgi:hypothetical protein